MRHLSIFIFFLLAVCARSYAGESIPRYTRIVTYKAVMKDTAWTTGAVVDRIRFVKYNKKGLKVIENVLNPDASVHTKSVYFYDDGNRILERAFYSAEKGQWIIGAYEYDEKGRVVKFTLMDSDRKETEVQTISYDSNNRIIQRISERLHDQYAFTQDFIYPQDGSKAKVIATDSEVGQYINDIIKNDTLSIHPNREADKTSFSAKPKKKNVTFEYDQYNNWMKMVEYDDKKTPEFISIRDIEYYGEQTDLKEVLLRGKVKTMEHVSYVAIPGNGDLVTKGERQGVFFRYHFNENGQKIDEEKYTETGALTEKIKWEHDEEGRVVKEIRMPLNNSLQSYAVWVYNKDGNVRNRVVFNARNEIIRNGLFRYDLEYNCIQEAWLNSDGSLYSDTRYQYNSFGLSV